ncbi:MAG: hypothetical protein H6563_11555 [Lewinellaceae bacterium]|nr:hypothetical protein [Lewinellaceae bacterium]
MLDAKFHIAWTAVVFLLLAGAGLGIVFFLLRHYAPFLIRRRKNKRLLKKWLDIAQPLFWAVYLLVLLAVLLSANFLVSGFLLAAIIVVGLDHWRRLFSQWMQLIKDRLRPSPEEERPGVQSILLSFPEMETPDARQLLLLAQKCPWIIADDSLSIEEKEEGRYELRARLVDPQAAAQVQVYFCNIAVRR